MLYLPPRTAVAESHFGAVRRREVRRVQHHPSLDTGRVYADVVDVYAYAIDAEGNVSAMVYLNREALDAASKHAPRTWALYPEHCAKHRALALLESAVAEKQRVA